MTISLTRRSRLENLGFLVRFRTIGEELESPLSTRAVLLQVLSIGPGYGSELMDRALVKFEVRLSAGSVYPCLTDLEDEGWIRRKRRKHARGCIYELTRRGEEGADGHRKLVARVFGFCENDPNPCGSSSTSTA